jgi:hypothetical protein
MHPGAGVVSLVAQLTKYRRGNNAAPGSKERVVVHRHTFHARRAPFPGLPALSAGGG